MIILEVLLIVKLVSVKVKEHHIIISINNGFSYLDIMVANSWKLMSPSLSLSAWVIILVTSASLSLSPMLAITCSSSGKLRFYNCQACPRSQPSPNPVKPSQIRA